MPANHTAEKTMPRDSISALLLSIAFPGVGQVYNGQAIKGLVFFVLRILCIIILSVTGVLASINGLIMLVCLQLVLHIYIVIDSVWHAKKRNAYKLKPYNNWFVYLILAISMTVIFLVFCSPKFTGLHLYNIPTNANSPALQIGDYVIADFNAYKNSDPDYGDIVVFENALGENVIFRLAGKPNDQISIVDNIVHVNGYNATAAFIQDDTVDGRSVTKYEVSLSNNRKHFIYKMKQNYDTEKSNMHDMEVPGDSYFLLGDNRDQALDSRYEGFVHKSAIKGKIVFKFRSTGIIGSSYKEMYHY